MKVGPGRSRSRRSGSVCLCLFGPGRHYLLGAGRTVDSRQHLVICPPHAKWPVWVVPRVPRLTDSHKPRSDADGRLSAVHQRSSTPPCHSDRQGESDLVQGQFCAVFRSAEPWAPGRAVLKHPQTSFPPDGNDLDCAAQLAALWQVSPSCDFRSFRRFC